MRNASYEKWPERHDIVTMQLETQVMWRWLGIIVGGVILLVSRPSFDQAWPLTCLLLGVAIFNGILATLIKTGRLPLARRNLGVAADILAISLAVYFTEGFQSSFFVFYALTILQQPLVMSFREIVSLSLAASVLYTAALFFKGDLHETDPNSMTLATVAFRICFLFLTALIAERGLKRSLSEYLRSEVIIESAAEGILVVDRDRRILRANPSAERLLGLPRASLKGRTCPDALKGQLCGEGCPLSMAMTARGTVSNVEEVLSPSQERAFPSRCSAAALLDAEGTLVGASMAFQDSSEAHAHEEARRDFVAAVVHELKSPLSSMMSLAEILSETEIESDEVRKEYARIIHRESRRAVNMIDRMRSLTRLERDEVVVTMEKRDLREIGVAAVALVRPDCDARRVLVSLRQSPTCVHALIDRDLALQVAVDLLQNAIRYSHENGEVILSVSNDGEEGVLEVQDRGIGIAEQDLPHIFDKFYRSDDAKAKDPSGSGLGLTLVHRMCDLMGATIHADSIPGRGSTFRVVFRSHSAPEAWAMPI